MMPKVHVIQINVHDMDCALDFYCGKLGFETLSRAFYPTLVVLAHTPMIVLFQKGQSAQSALLAVPPVQLALQIQTPSLALCLEEMRGKGVDLVHETIQDSEYGVYFDVRDPTGTAISIVRCD